MGPRAPAPAFIKRGVENKISVYYFQWEINHHLYRAAASRKPVVIRHVGLDTFKGNIRKYIRKIDQISFSGEIAIEAQRKILYVTGRCIFRMARQGLLQKEIAPGIDVPRDILDQMMFEPSVVDNLKTMNAGLYRI